MLPWTRRSQFSQTPEENSTKSHKFQFKYQKRRKKLTISFFTQIFLRRSSAQFWQLNRKENARRPEIFCSLSENDQKKLSFLNSCFSSNCSSGYVDCCFDKPAEKNDKQPNLSLHVRKRFDKFEKMFSPKCPYWHVQCRFDNPVGKNSSKDRFFMLTVRIWWNTLSSSKMNFLKLFLQTRTMQFW